MLIRLRLATALLVWSATAGRVGVECCNARKLREAVDIVQSRFHEELRTDDCGEDGDQCRWDRDCCAGYECSLGGGGGGGGAGLGLYCRRGAVERVVAASGGADVEPDGAWRDGQGAADDRSSQSGGEWMLADSRDRQDSEEDTTAVRLQNKRTDTIGELERLKENKREKLIRENAELERLFTEREERELDQLRALKEDAEMEELRRLKELRLKRKLELIRELKELRKMKAEAQLDAMDELKDENIRAEKDYGEEGAIEGTNFTTTLPAENRTLEEAEWTTEVTTKRVNKQGIRGNHHHGHKGKKHHKGKEHEGNATEVATPIP